MEPAEFFAVWWLPSTLRSIKEWRPALGRRTWLRKPHLAVKDVVCRSAPNFEATAFDHGVDASLRSKSSTGRESSIPEPNDCPTILATLCQLFVAKEINNESKNDIGADTSLRPSITRSGAFSERSYRQRSRCWARAVASSGSARSQSFCSHMVSGASIPRPYASR